MGLEAAQETLESNDSETVLTSTTEATMGGKTALSVWADSKLPNFAAIVDASVGGKSVHRTSKKQTENLMQELVTEGISDRVDDEVGGNLSRWAARCQLQCR